MLKLLQKNVTSFYQKCYKNMLQKLYYRILYMNSYFYFIDIK